MTDLITQAINEASTTTQFAEAAMLVVNHIHNNRDPDMNAAHVAHLAYRGHVLIHETSASTENDILFRVGAQYIAGAVLGVLATEPKV